MKSWTSIAVIWSVALLSFPLVASASTLSCYQVDGMAIFGYDGSEYVHIGAIGNEFNSLSIANEFGAGSEFKSTSIFNEFGRYGSEFRSTSAFNEFATNPPIIVSSDYEFVGYLTLNEFKTPNINTYEAVACAKKSFRSPSRSMQDITFKRIPSGGDGSGGGLTQTEYDAILAALATSCPVNSTSIGGTCTCNSGYTANGSVCVTETQGCQQQYGGYSYGSGGYCYCSSGYEFNSTRTLCIPTPESVPVATQTFSESTSCDARTLAIPDLCNPGYRPICPNGKVMCEPAPATESTSATPSAQAAPIQTTEPQFVDFDVPDADVDALQRTMEVVTSASFRRCPSTDCTLIRYYAESSEINVSGKYKKADWYRVRGTTDAGASGQEITGWVHGSLLAEIENSGNEVDTGEAQVTPASDSTRGGFAARLWQTVRGWFR